MIIDRRRFLSCAATSLIPIAVRPAWSQSYPARPVRVVVPAPPGGTIDPISRLLADALQRRYGQPLVKTVPIGVGATRGKTFSITGMVEKPKREVAPSNLIITGRYILQPQIFDILATQTGGAGGEIQITDAMITLAKSQPFYGLKFEGRSFDCGSKVGFLAANVAYALAREDIAPAFRDEIRRLLGEIGRAHV